MSVYYLQATKQTWDKSSSSDSQVFLFGRFWSKSWGKDVLVTLLIDSLQENSLT